QGGFNRARGHVGLALFPFGDEGPPGGIDGLAGERHRDKLKFRAPGGKRPRQIPSWESSGSPFSSLKTLSAILPITRSAPIRAKAPAIIRIRKPFLAENIGMGYLSWLSTNISFRPGFGKRSQPLRAQRLSVGSAPGLCWGGVSA